MNTHFQEQNTVEKSEESGWEMKLERQVIWSCELLREAEFYMWTMENLKMFK